MTCAFCILKYYDNKSLCVNDRDSALQFLIVQFSKLSPMCLKNIFIIFNIYFRIRGTVSQNTKMSFFTYRELILLFLEKFWVDRIILYIWKWWYSSYSRHNGDGHSFQICINRQLSTTFDLHFGHIFSTIIQYDYTKKCYEFGSNNSNF